MSSETQRPAMSDLVNPFLTEKTRRAVAAACGITPVGNRIRAHFFKTLTVGKMLQHIPTYDKFCELARKQGHLGSNALMKVHPIYFR